MNLKTFPFLRILRFLTAIICILVFSGCAKSTRTTEELEQTTFGIDVARYQGTIDWQKVSTSGMVDFAMVRIGYRSMADGQIKPDSNGKYNLQEASRAGIKLGVYFFSTAITEEEAREEAAWVAEQIACYPITYPVVYDCENYGNPDSRQYGMTNKERTNAALAFLEAIEDLGYEGMFYASKMDMENNNHWEMGKIQDEYKVWVAQYPAEPYPITAETSYSGTHHMWQYSMEGTVPGIDGPVDMNVAYFGYDGIEQQKDKNTPEDVEPDVEARMDFDEVSESVTAKQETNLRNIPSQDTDSQVIATLKNGQVAQRIAVSNSGWSKVLFEGNVYYAVSSYLTTDLSYGDESEIQEPAETDPSSIKTQFNETNQLVTAKDAVNLRALPSVEHEDATVIAQLKHGDVATCVGTSENGWSKLIYRGTTCYAVSSYLMPAQTVASSSQEEMMGISFSERNEQVTAVDKVNLRSIPSTERKDSAVITQLYHGDIAIRTGISSNGWSRLVYGGTTCYAVSRYLEVIESEDNTDNFEYQEVETEFEECNEQVTAKVEVNLRSIPSVEDPNCIVIATLKNGEYVTRTGINQDLGWSRVVYQGQVVYCISSYLTK